MAGTDIKIQSSDGGEFDCYVAAPSSGKGAGVVLAASVMGVDEDLRSIADRFAAAGIVAAAPDLFWRTDYPGPLPRGSEFTRVRSQPRDERIAAGVQDIADTGAMLKVHPNCNGKLAAVGFCYGGPYAVIGMARLGFDAGFAYHGTQVHLYMDDLKACRGPIGLHWGDLDHAAPPEALEAVREAIADMPNVELYVYPGVKHGYTAASGDSYDAAKTDHSITRTIEVLKGLSVEAAAAE